MKKKLLHIGEKHLRYNMKKWKKKGYFDTLNDICEMITLAQLMETLGYTNHAIIIVGYYIFDSNYKKILCLKSESLDLICSPSVGKEQVVKFEKVFYAIR